MKLTTVLVVQALALAAAPAQNAAFYRMASTNETRIVACDPANALLTWTSAWPNACCTLERAASPGGPWSSDFSHTVVADTGSGGTALVPLGAGVPSDAFNCPAVLARMTNAIRIGTNSYRIETWLCRDMMPVTDPLRGIWARVRLIETNGFPIPSSTTIPRFRVINGTEVWDVYAPPRTSGTPPYLLEVSGGYGPLWVPHTRVDVLLEVADGNVRYLLKASGQEIQGVY